LFLGRSNIAARFLSTGYELPIEEAFQITHRQTNMYLSCDPSFGIMTEFGVEYECFADRSAANGKLSLVVSEFNGLSTSQTLNKPDAPVFLWHFLVSKNKSNNFDASRTFSNAKPATTDNLIQELQNEVLSKGMDGFWNLRSYFQELENKMVGKGKFESEDLKNALVKWGIQMKHKYIDIVINAIDTQQNGLIDFRDLLAVVRGRIPDSRVEFLRRVFDALDAKQNGLVALHTLKENFKGEDHPLVRLNGYTQQEALQHVLSSFDINGKTVKAIDFNAFAEYYYDLSPAINDDDYFEGIVKSNWF
jgi:Ca2+-binding EF-hand superfamily protein